MVARWSRRLRLACCAHKKLESMAESIIVAKMPLNNLDKGQYYDWDGFNNGTHLKSLIDA